VTRIPEMIPKLWALKFKFRAQINLRKLIINTRTHLLLQAGLQILEISSWEEFRTLTRS
jgi:hypothetical protein